MQKEIKVHTSVNDINKDSWASLVQISPVASWFQTPEAYRFFDSLSFLEAFCIAVESDSVLKGVVVGYIQKDGGKIKQFFSRRAIINGGPLLANDISDEEIVVLLTAVKEKLNRKAIFVETRNYNDYSRWKAVFEKCGYKYEPHYDIQVDTTTMDVVNSNIGKSRKRDIRVSLRDGASIVEKPSNQQIEDYYLILKELYKNKVKTPLFPFEFFEQLFQLSDSFFLLVEYSDKIVGGTVCVGLKGKALYEMFACGQDGVYKNIFPSELATFSGIQQAVNSGYPFFDMMGAGKPDDGGYGVRDFKLKFGGKLVEFGRYNYICNRFLYNIGKLGVKLLKKL